MIYLFIMKIDKNKFKNKGNTIKVWYQKNKQYKDKLY